MGEAVVAGEAFEGLERADGQVHAGGWQEERLVRIRMEDS